MSRAMNKTSTKTAHSTSMVQEYTIKVLYHMQKHILRAQEAEEAAEAAEKQKRERSAKLQLARENANAKARAKAQAKEDALTAQMKQKEDARAAKLRQERAAKMTKQFKFSAADFELKPSHSAPPPPSTKASTPMFGTSLSTTQLSDAPFGYKPATSVPAITFSKDVALDLEPVTTDLKFSTGDFNFNKPSPNASAEPVTKAHVVFGASSQHQVSPVPSGSFKFAAGPSNRQRKIATLKSRSPSPPIVKPVTVVTSPSAPLPVFIATRPMITTTQHPFALIEVIVMRTTLRVLLTSNIGTPCTLLASVCLPIRVQALRALKLMTSTPSPETVQPPMAELDTSEAAESTTHSDALVQVGTTKPITYTFTIKDRTIVAFCNQMMQWLIKNDFLPQPVYTSKSLKWSLMGAMSAEFRSGCLKAGLPDVITKTQSQGLMTLVGASMAGAAVLKLNRIARFASSLPVTLFPLSYPQRPLLEKQDFPVVSPSAFIGPFRAPNQANASPMADVALPTACGGSNVSHGDGDAATHSIKHDLVDPRIDEVTVNTAQNKDVGVDEPPSQPSEAPHDTTATSSPTKSSSLSVEAWVAAAHLQIGTVSYTDFLEALISTGDGRSTRKNIAAAFVELSNEERECLGYPAHEIHGGIDGLLDSRMCQRKVKIGNIKLAEFLTLLDFTDDVASDQNLGRAFKAASQKEQALAERIGARIVC